MPKTRPGVQEDPHSLLQVGPASDGEGHEAGVEGKERGPRLDVSLEGEKELRPVPPGLPSPAGHAEDHPAVEEGLGRLPAPVADEGRGGVLALLRDDVPPIPTWERTGEPPGFDVLQDAKLLEESVLERRCLEDAPGL